MMNVTIKQLNAFVAIAQSQSFAEACDEIHLSQPALSITIKNLEQTLGGQLLARSTRTLALTPEGQAFLPIARRLLSDWDQALGDISTLFSLRRGRLTMAAMPFFANTRLPNILSTFQEKYPNINISLHDIVNEAVIDATRHGRVEIGVCFDPGETDDLQFEGLFTEQFVALLPPHHQLAEKTQATWAELFSYPFITLLHPASLQDYMKEVAKQVDLTFTPHIETHQLSTIGRMVALGMGVSAVPQSCTDQMIAMGAVCLPLQHPTLTRQVGIIYRRRYAISTAANAMKTIMSVYFSQDESIIN